MNAVARRDSSEFDSRLERCSSEVREVVRFLRTAAEHASPAVEAPTLEVRGVGVTYWVRGRRFCRFDPKEQAGHVWVLIPGGSRPDLENAGEVSPRDDGPWLAITDMYGAVRLVPAMLASCERASGNSV